MNRSIVIAIAIVFGVGSAGVAGIFSRTPKPAAKQNTPPASPDSRPIVWVVDGAGGMGGCSKGMVEANLAAGSPVEVIGFVWSHGKGRLILDQIDAAHARKQSRRLAEKIAERRKMEPGRRIAVVAHSAGSGVTLGACELLPADSIDRIVLLAPAVSTNYDIEPALRKTREGIDVFGSKKDWLTLGVGVRLVGTADRHWAPAAGRAGFRMTALAKQDLEQNRLRQYFWSSDLAWTGYSGGHRDIYAPTFLQVYIYPLIVPGFRSPDASPRMQEVRTKYAEMKK